MDTSCAFCGFAVGNTRCGNCNMIYYCNVDHQAKHWENHRDKCKITLATNARLGRHYIASKAFAIDDVIYQEANPLLMYAVEEHEIINTGLGLSYCTEMNFQDIYNKICELKSDKPKYTRFKSLQFKVCNLDTTFVEALKKEIDCEIPDQELSQIYSRIRYNTVSYVQHDKCYVTVFGGFSFFSHSCMNNAAYDFMETEGNLIVQVKAVQPISQGDLVNISYIPLFRNTFRRQRQLSFYDFACDCARCKDVTELGTNFGTIKCLKCGNYIYFELSKMCYKCSNGACLFEVNANRVDLGTILVVFSSSSIDLGTILNLLKESLDEAANLQEKTVIMMQWLKFMEKFVHPNHVILFQCRFELLKVAVSNWSLDDWKPYSEMAIEHRNICANLLNIVTTLTPQSTATITELESMQSFFSDVIGEPNRDDRPRKCCNIL